jgi:hypothetical protein
MTPALLSRELRSRARRRLNPRQLAWKMAGTLPLDLVARRFRCERCDQRDAAVLPSRHRIDTRD